MKKPTPAGMKVLLSFKMRPTDQFETNQMLLRHIHVRSGLRSVNVYRTVEKLEEDGYLQSKYGFDGYWWSLTDAGISAIQEN